MEKATELKGKKTTVNALFEKLIWSKIGAEHDAFMTVDPDGVSSWSGGLNMTTRDLARVGQMIMNKGKVGNEQILSPKVFEYVHSRKNRKQFIASGVEKAQAYKRGWSYANQFWWTNNDHGAFGCRGIHGQAIYIDPKTKTVFAIHSSHETPSGNAYGDIFGACESVSKCLLKNGKE